MTAHAHAAAAVDQAVAVGADGIEHASYMIRSAEGGPAQALATEEQLAALAASGIAVCPTLGGHIVESLAPASQRIQQALGAAVTPEVFVEMRMSILRRMTTFGVRLISGTDAGIARIKAHGRYIDAVIELGQVTGTVPALVASSSSAAAAIGLARPKGRLRRGYDADVIVVDGDLTADLTALRHVRQVVLRGVPVLPPAQS